VVTALIGRGLFGPLVGIGRGPAAARLAAFLAF